MIRRCMLFVALWLAIASPAAAQNYLSLDGTTATTFKIRSASASPATLTVSGGTLSLGPITTASQITSTLSTGTAPMAIASTTKVSNLNVDAVDGYSIASGSNGGVAYQSSSTQLSWSAAGTTGQLLVSGGSGSPTWAGLTSAQIIVGNGSNIPTAVAMSGDVTISNAGVTAIGNATLSGAEFSTAVEDEIVKATLSAGSETGNAIVATFQVKDVNGNNLAGVYRVGWNISDSQNGVTDTGNAVTTTYSSGAEWQQITANKKAWANTNSSGVLALSVSYASAGTMYLMVEIGGKVYNVALTFA